MSLQCAICERPVSPQTDNRFYPLCSERCRLVDLGKWLGGDYAIPGNPTNDYGAPHFERNEDEL
ncbi:MAG: DNA gyrase inhibitor YacG [Myxococcota bacterium]|nr:DNA gyrase inhibitor YacG [Myxococcota bacterium]